MAQQQYASFDPKDLKTPNTLFDNVNAEITGFAFTREAPDNYKAEGNPIFAVINLNLYDLTRVDGESAEEFKQRQNQSQSYSLGAAVGNNWAPSEDGFALVPSVDDPNAPSKDSKFGTFVTALAAEGVPKTLLGTGHFKAIVGLKGRFKRVDDKERSFGNQVQAGRKVSKFPPSTLVLAKLISLPGQKAAGTTAAVTTSPAGDIDETTELYLSSVVGSAPGGKVQRGNILISVRKATSEGGEDKDRGMAIAKRASEESFLIAMNEKGVLKYDPSVKPQAVFAVAA